MRPRLLRPRYQVIHKVGVEIFPFTPLTELLKGHARRDVNAATFASTMTMGGGAIVELSRELKPLTKNVFIALDAGLMFAGKQGEMMAEYLADHPSISLFPITSGIDFKTIHHWKMVFNEGADQSVLSSMNLSTPLNTPFTDLAYTFSEAEVSRELRSYLYAALQKQCEAWPDFKCYVDFSHDDQDLRAVLYRMFERSCERLGTYFKTQPRLNASPRFFMQPHNTDMAYLIAQMVDDARQEIVLMTHKFSQLPVLEALQRAAARGVRVFVFSTKRPRQYGRKLTDFFHYPSSKTAARRVPEPHMKVMVIDRAKMLFGTGNFTPNAFNDARELFAVTDDKEAIAQVLRVAAALYHSHRPAEHENFGLDAAAQPWIVLTQTVESKQGRMYTPPHSEIPAELWLRHYRKVSLDFLPQLKACGLGSLLLIPEADFAECVRRVGKTIPD
jgi:hypothetical protein